MGTRKLIDILETLVTAHAQLQELKKAVTLLRSELRLEIREVGRRVDGFVERLAKVEERYEFMSRSIKSEIIGEMEAKLVASAAEFERIRSEIRKGLFLEDGNPNPGSDAKNE